MFTKLFKRIDWTLFFLTWPILGAGLITMTSFTSVFLEPARANNNIFFTHQLIWISISFIIFLLFSMLDFSFLKRTDILVALFLFFCFLLGVLFVLGHVSNGAQSWFSLGGISIQPSDMMKLVVILMLAKYFSRRHVEIAHWRHIFVSGIYALIPFLLVFFQPDFGSAIIIFMIWFGMALVSGISKKHLLAVLFIGLSAFLGLWLFVFKPYQKERILNFVHPLTNIQGSGYNAYQSTIAVGSGQILGKGVGYGTQSRLQFLPEYQTDFVFAAFAEEWGFVGVIILLVIFTFIIFRILSIAMLGATNFEILYGLGVAILLMSHVIINIGMNIGLLPVTGITLPFMSYGGSHLVTEFAALGILMSMRGYSRTAHKDDMKHEFVGLERT